MRRPVKDVELDAKLGCRSKALNQRDCAAAAFFGLQPREPSMRNTSWPMIGLLAAALVGCNKLAPPAAVPTASGTGVGAAIPAATSPCAGGPERPININPGAMTGTTGTINVNPDPASIGQAAVGVRWKLHKNGQQTFAFTTDGVAFKASAPASGPLSSPPTGKSDEFVWCFDSTTGNQAWPYTVKFVDTAAPTQIWSCDPTIVNSEVLEAGAAASAPAAAASSNVTCTRSP